MKRLKETKGFTLIELLLVVVIIGLMLAVIVPRAWRANIDAKYGLVRQNCSELASWAHDWAETMIAAQDEVASTATLDDYMQSLTATFGTSARYIARNIDNVSWNDFSTQRTVAGRRINGIVTKPEASVEAHVPPDKIPRNPFNGVSVFENPNDPYAGSSCVTGAIACAGINENTTTGWNYYALLFQGTDNTVYGYNNDNSFHAGQGLDLGGLRNGIFLARLR